MSKPKACQGSVKNEDKEKNEPYTILEPEYVNKRRKEVGLGPIEEYLCRWDIKREVEQK